jgi:chromate reductase, NAD(P)H dehydrogenase (quinone)
MSYPELRPVSILSMLRYTVIIWSEPFLISTQILLRQQVDWDCQVNANKKMRNMENRLKILGFAGSLRKGSYNRSLLRSATQLLPSDTTLEIFDLSDIPSYNQDHDNNMPPKVKEFKTKIRESDALLIATPEYNYSVPGVLKNAIDYASRPYGDNSFDDKPVAIMSASVGMIGGARAQYHLRQMFVFLNMHPVNVPEVIVTFASNKFDSEGNLLDENTKKFLAQLLRNLSNWTKRLKEKKTSSV